MESLPKEIQLNIAEWLDIKSRRMLRSTNTTWFSRIQINKFTMYFAKPSTLPNMVDLLLKYPYNISLQLEKMIYLSDKENTISLLNQLARLTNLEEINANYDSIYIYRDVKLLTTLTNLKYMNFEAHPEVLQRFPNLTQLHLYDSANMAAALIQQYSQLRNLTLLKSFVDVPSLHPDPKMLTTLELINLDVPYSFALSKLVNLKRLVVGCNVIENEDQHELKLRGLFNLEYMHIESIKYDTFESLTRLTYLSVSVYGSEMTIEKLRTWTALGSLRELDMEFLQFEDNVPRRFFTALTSLEKLKMEVHRANQLKYVRRRTLKRLWIKLHDNVQLKNVKSFPFLDNVTITFQNYYGNRDLTPLLASKHLTRLHLVLLDSNFNWESVPPTLKSFKVTGAFFLNNKVEVPSNFNFGRFPNLESLTMTGYNNETLVTLTNLTRLRVDVANTDHQKVIEFTALKYMTNIKHLQLELSVSDASFETIGTLVNLTKLDLLHLNDNNLKLMTSLTNLKDLCIRNQVSIRGDDLTKFTSLQKLKFNMPGNAFHLLKLDLQKKLPYLYSLDINSAINKEE